MIMKLNFKKGRENKIHIFVDGQYRMTADSEFVSSLGYCENYEIDEEELAGLERAVSSRRAFNKAADLLSRRDHSEKELIIKLKQKGFQDEAADAVEKLKYYGYVDDSRFAQSFAKELQRVKKYGKRRIEQELYKKGISKDIISEALESLVFEESELVDLIEKKYKRYLTDEKGRQKTVAALMRKGYSYGEIKDALNALSNSEEENEEYFFENFCDE